jgi:chitin disaccharide deacetylase
LRARFRKAGIAAPDQVFGLAWSGAMTAPRLTGLLENLPEGLTEIYTHPATGPYSGSAPGYQYGAELAALTQPELKSLLVRRGIKSGGFGDFSSQ